MSKGKINETGASGIIRQIVGNAPENQRKSILQKYYSKVLTSQELQEKNPKLNIVDKYGADNLFFVDKKDNLTVYNPPGLDFGDVASVGREIASTVGGFAGGVLASPGVATTPIGVALGSEGAGQLYDIGMDAVTPGGVDRPLAQNLIRAGENIGMEAVGGKIADNTMRGLKNIVQKGTQTLTGIKPGQRARDFDNIGVQPTVATLTGSRGVANVEEVLGGNIFAADIIGASRDKLQKQLQDVVGKITTNLGDAAPNIQDVGTIIKTGSKNYFDKIQAKKEILYGAAFDAAGNAKVNLNNVRTLKANLENELASAPNTLKSIYKPSLDKINNLLNDAADGSVPLTAARQIRTEIGKIIGPATPGKIKIESTGDGKLNAIYGALSKDIFSSVDAVSPQASRLLKKADQYNKFVSKKTGGVEKTIENIQNKALDSQVFSFAMQGGKQGSQRIREVFKTLTKPERDAVSSTIFSRLGYNKADPQSGWSPTTFLNEWDKLDTSVKKVLFNRPRQKEVAKEIDSLVRVVRTVDERRLLNNPSRTGSVNIGFANVTSLLTSGGLFLTGQPIAGTAVAGTVLAPRFAAKLMTSPKFIRWVKSTAQVANKGVNPLAIQFGKLAALPGKDGELAEAINAFTGNLSQNLSLPTVNIE
ncbi:hypothetical protein OAM56_07020 [Alphaproteobacteria bacterium]|nr:hypothetical protein [Alphaproteobacteria bacterium]